MADTETKGSDMNITEEQAVEIADMLTTKTISYDQFARQGDMTWMGYLGCAIEAIEDTLEALDIDFEALNGGPRYSVAGHETDVVYDPDAERWGWAD